VKVTIDGEEFRGVPVGSWTYFEADEVKRITRLTVGEIPGEYARGDAGALFAIALAAWVRAGKPADELAARRRDPSFTINSIAVAFDEDEVESEEDGTASPPDEGAAAA
jgi:hypothetical protein